MPEYHCTLAKKYDPDKHNVMGWLVSEKLDGVRGLWCPDRKGFFSRSNKPLNVPPSWQERMASCPLRLDGEFWMGRGQFQSVVSAVRKKEPTEEQFAGVKFVIFDTVSEGSWDTRMRRVITDWDDRPADSVFMLPHAAVVDMDEVSVMYNEILAAGGEGLMFRHPKAGYELKRTGNLLKWKDEIDGTALVTGMVEGEGKHAGRMGALVCVDDETGVTFRVGTGFSDEEREFWWERRQCCDTSAYQIRWRAMRRTRDNVPREPAYICIHTGD